MDGQPTPCGQCQSAPVLLWADNVLPARLWSTLDGQRRFQIVPASPRALMLPERISLQEASLLVERHGGDNRDLELVLLIEGTVYPAILGRAINVR